MPASEVWSLYRLLIREARKFPSYNFRSYALRRIRDGFRECKGLEDPKLIQEQLEEGRTNLGIIKRQVIIGNLYRTNELVIEKRNKS